MRLTVVDGNNYFRRRIETISVGSPIRSCFYELHQKPGLVICVWDGVGGLKPRRALHPEYKMNRKPAGESIYESQNLFKKLLGFSGVIQVQVDGYEGDDVIAHLVKRYEQECPDMYIESNDLDLYQLGIPMSRDKYPDLPENIQIYKTMVGDPSDNIPGCKAFAKTSWEKLKQSEKEILIQCLEDPNSTGESVRPLIELFMPTRSLSNFCDNLEQLKMFYKVVGFIDVPTDLVDTGTTSGMCRVDLAENLFKEFLL